MTSLIDGCVGARSFLLDVCSGDYLFCSVSSWLWSMFMGRLSSRLIGSGCSSRVGCSVRTVTR